MTFVKAIESSLSQYMTFRGRAARSEFWFFNLFSSICSVVAIIIDNILGTQFKNIDSLSGGLYGYIYLLVALGLFIPNLSVSVRRLHDTNRSGRWYWILLVPLIGVILLLVWLCSKGTGGDNEYGPDPLSGDIK
jgi:uncharacterized membrane protein YhaH (DUF805 family)